MKAVMYGAGNIGRGFIGQLLSASGYEVVFIDVNKQIIDELNTHRSYPLRIVNNQSTKEIIVNNVRAVFADDIESVANEIADADIMATAVGVNILHHIINPICSGLKKRFDRGGKPLNIIICENLIDADKYLRHLIEDRMTPEYKAVLDQKLGLIQASIGRMVPVMTDEMRGGNKLMIWAEPYDKLPVDKAAFIGDVPQIKGIVPFSPFAFYIKRKLFIHNMSHAMCAYLGWQKGYTYIYECVSDDKIRKTVYDAMIETSKALHNEYGIAIKELDDHIEDLLNRFGNTVLGDTVVRVGRDPQRKLGSNDRLIGAALYCISQGCDISSVIDGIVSALCYDNAEDESAVDMQRIITQQGVKAFLVSDCGLSEESDLLQRIVSRYQDEKGQKQKSIYIENTAIRVL